MFKKNNAFFDVHLKVRFANDKVRSICKEFENSKQPPTIQLANTLDKTNDNIQIAEVTSLRTTPLNSQLWFHHGDNSLAKSPEMLIQVDGINEQLQFKIHGQWMYVETFYSGLCLFYAPVKALNTIREKGNFGYSVYKDIEKTVDIIEGLPWIKGIVENIPADFVNDEQQLICTTYTNEAIQLVIQRIYDGGEHPVRYEAW